MAKKRFIENISINCVYCDKESDFFKCLPNHEKNHEFDIKK